MSHGTGKFSIFISYQNHKARLSNPPPTLWHVYWWGSESNFWTKGDKNKQSIMTWPLGAPLLCKINPTGINTTLWRKHMQASWAARDYNNIGLSFLSCAILVCQLRSPLKEQYYVTVDERDSLLKSRRVFIVVCIYTLRYCQYERNWAS